MNVHTQIAAYKDSLTETKRKDLERLDTIIMRILPNAQIWFDNGINEHNKVVSNPTIGYGYFLIQYANGDTKPFFQIGISTNTTGISVYLLGLKDKNYLRDTYSKTIGKAKITGYCIKFRKLDDIQINVLKMAIRYAINHL